MSYAYDNDEFSRYYDKFVDNLPRDAFWIDTVDKIYAELIERTFVDNQRTVVVELGCGTGTSLISYGDKFKNKDIKLIGIDHSQVMLDRAKEKLINQSNNSIEFLHGSLTNFADCLETKIIDCILLPAGTFHHLITDNEREMMIDNIQQTLRPKTGLFVIYLMPEPFIRVEPTDNSNSEDKLELISAENIQQTDNEWICKQIFEFNAPPKTEISWQIRTCSIPKLINLFLSKNFEPILCCLNGKYLLSYNENLSSSLIDNTTPVILVFHTIKNTN